MDFERTLDNYSDDGVQTINESEQSPLFDKFYSYVLRFV